MSIWGRMKVRAFDPIARSWLYKVHIHFNDEPRNLSNPDHLEAGGKGTWAEKMVYCEDCWYWPWQVREATSTGFELLSSRKSFRFTFSGGGAVSRRPGLRGGPWDRSSPWHRPLAKQVVSYVSKGTVFRGQQNPAAIFWNLLRIIFLCLMTCCPADVGHSPSGGASQWRYWIGARGFPKLLWASILLYS